MDYTYLLSVFPNRKANLDRLTQEIAASPITIAVNFMEMSPTTVIIHFKATLSNSEIVTLGNIIAVHSGEPLPEDIIQQVKIVAEQPKYIEGGNPTQELFSAESVFIDVSDGEMTKNVDISWPFDISLKSGTLFINAEMVGDEISVEIAPNTIIGALNFPLNSGDTIARVTPTVIQNIKKGYYFSLNGQEIGRVTSISESSFTFTPPSPISVAIGTYVGITPKIIPYAYLNAVGILEVGKNMTTGNRVPKNAKIRIKYKNNNGLAKKISWFVEYLY
jgi:hypothetical protein